MDSELEEFDTREFNVGNSDYSKHTVQPWDVWKAYPNMNPFDADIIKRVLRTKEGDCRTMEYEKIIHICQERLSHFKLENGSYVDKVYNEV